MAFGLLLSGCDEPGGAEGQGWLQVASFPEPPAALMFSACAKEDGCRGRRDHWCAAAFRGAFL